MSEARAKAVRRAARRLVGEESASVLAAQSRLLTQKVVPSLASTDRTLIRHHERLVAQETSIERLQAFVLEWHRMSFWQRLRWIVRGL